MPFNRNRKPALPRGCLPVGLAVLMVLSVRAGKAAESNLAAPTLWLSANRQTSLEVGQGWPLLIRVQVLNEQLALHPETEQTQLITAVTGNWPDSLTLQIIGPNGSPVECPAQAASEVHGPLSLSGDSGGQAGWWIAPEVTGSLEPGLYRAQVLLNTTNAIEGWQGLARSQVVEITVRSGSDAWSDESAAEKTFQESQYAVWQGNTIGAIALLNGLLVDQPSLLPALTQKADLLLASGAEEEATQVYECALEQFLLASIGNHFEPPRRLLQNRRNLLAKRLFVSQREYAPVRAFLTNNHQLAIEWPAATGKQYQVESSSDLRNWTARTGPLAGKNGLQVWMATSDDTMQFFRVLVVP